MSDDERIEQLELENKILQKNNKGLKAKIDEQSKEIEELKEDNKHQWEERCKLTFELENSTSNDKIKAKIEEYKKEIEKLYKKKNWHEPWDTEKKTKYMHYIEFGKSLLEKE